MNKSRSITYKSSGVDIDRANDFVGRIKPLVEKTYTKGTLGTIGHYGGFFKADFAEMKNPVLVSSADGVGTKLMVASLANRFDTVGIDLVAMCVNDIVSCGAKPLFFLDYFATGKIKPDVAVDILKGIAKGCRTSRCALLGGETAEMPGLYKSGDLDLAGFCVGVVDKSKILDGSRVRPGDRLVGLASSGIHSNGYSLVRRLFSKSEMKGKYSRQLLEPTAIYVDAVLKLIDSFAVKAATHITGGGFYDNIPRVLPDGTAVTIDKDSWKIPKIFETIKKRAKAKEEELYRNFNMGIGMVVVLKKEEAPAAVKKLKDLGVKSWDIGEVIKWARKEVIL